MKNQINNLLDYNVNMSKYRHGFDDDTDERMLNPIFKSRYRRVGDAMVRKNIPYKCGVNKYNTINEITGKPMQVKGEVTKTTADRKYCNEALSWNNIEDTEPDERTEKFLNRTLKPMNGPKNKAIYNMERSLIQRNLESGEISFEQFIANLDAMKQRINDTNNKLIRGTV